MILGKLLKKIMILFCYVKLGLLKMAILFWRDTIILITRGDIAIQNVKETL